MNERQQTMASMNEVNILLPGTDGYYRKGNKVYNKRNQELIPDQKGRYKLKIYTHKYLIYRAPGEINKPVRKDINQLKPLPNYPGYYYEVVDDEEILYNKHGKLLKSDKFGSYYLKNREGEYRRIKLKKILK